MDTSAAALTAAAGATDVLATASTVPRLRTSATPPPCLFDTGCTPPTGWLRCDRVPGSCVQEELFARGVEVPVKVHAGALYVRISVHVYNALSDYTALADAVDAIVADGAPCSLSG